jgi:hypothetical protein
MRIFAMSIPMLNVAVVSDVVPTHSRLQLHCRECAELNSKKKKSPNKKRWGRLSRWKSRPPPRPAGSAAVAPILQP